MSYILRWIDVEGNIDACYFSQLTDAKCAVKLFKRAGDLDMYYIVGPDKYFEGNCNPLAMRF